MPRRALKAKEQQNFESLGEEANSALLFPTATTLRKDYMDAVIPLRALLKNKLVYDYDEQPRGNQQEITAHLGLGTVQYTSAMMYRPITPNKTHKRIRISGLPAFCSPDDVLAVLVERGDLDEPILRIINLSTESVPAGYLDHSKYQTSVHGGHRSYENVDPKTGSGKRDPHEVDSDKFDRGTKAHKQLQEDVAGFLTAEGIEPLSPAGDGYAYDIGWAQDTTTVVCEIKSFSEGNEERQLRLALGQVLRYRQIFDPAVGTSYVKAAIVVEYKPPDSSWFDLLAEMDINIAWPGTFERLID